MSEDLNAEIERLKDEMQANILALLASSPKIVSAEMVQEALFRVVNRPEVGIRCKSIAVDQASHSATIEVEMPPHLARLIKWADQERRRGDAFAGYAHYDVLIRKNATGEVRRHRENLPWLEHSLFWWTEGNFACDCNRQLEFDRAGGVESPLDGLLCGNTAYTVIKAIFPDGTPVSPNQFDIWIPLDQSRAYFEADRDRKPVTMTLAV